MSNSRSRLNPFNRLIQASFIPFAALTALPALAQQLPSYNSGDAARDANTPNTPRLPARPETPPAPVIREEAEKPMTLGEGEKVLVRYFKVEGGEFLDTAEVAAQLEPYRNRELTIVEINAAANRITVLARGKGYLVARAYVPKQEMRNGVLTIQLIAGRYGEFIMKNSSLVSDARLQAMFDEAKRASPMVTLSSLERPILLVNDTPGAKMPQVSITPGTQFGTSDLVVETEPATRLGGYALLDNYGSRFTGKNRLSAGLSVNSPLGIGDRFSLSGLSTERGGLQNGRASYGLPLAANGLRAEVAVSRTTYRLGAEFADLQAHGVADSVEATLSYPLKRTRDDSLYLSLNLADRRLRDNVDLAGLSIAKRAQAATVSLQKETFGTLFGFSSYYSLGGSLTYGKLDYDDPALQAANRAGVNTVGNYAKANLAFSGSLTFTNRWSVLANLRVQQSFGKNLDGSEQLSISGPSGIKSYPDSVVNDNGYLGGAELRYTLTPGAAEHAVGAFINSGTVRPNDGRFTILGKISIGDAGLAYTLLHKTFFARIEAARTLGNQLETASYNRKTKILASVGVRF